MNSSSSIIKHGKNPVTKTITSKMAKTVWDWLLSENEKLARLFQCVLMYVFCRFGGFFLFLSLFHL